LIVFCNLMLGFWLIATFIVQRTFDGRLPARFLFVFDVVFIDSKCCCFWIVHR